MLARLEMPRNYGQTTEMKRKNSVVAADLQTLVLGALRVADAAVIAGAAFAAYWARHDSWLIPDLYLIAILAAAGLAANYLQIARVYVFENLSRLASQFGKIAMAWSAVMASLLALAYFTQTSVAFSRAFAIGWYALGFGGLILVRLLLLVLIDRWRRQGRLAMNVAVIGAGEMGRAFLKHLADVATHECRIVGVYDDRKDRLPETIEGQRVAGTVDDLIAYCRTNPVDEIVVALPWQASADLQELIKKLKIVPVDVKLCPDYIGTYLPARGFHAIAGIPMLSVLERPLSGWSLVLKALEDRILAAILLVLLAPLLLAIAAAVKLDSPGPALFRQRRYGFANNEIVVFKFRTMFHQRAEDASVPQATRNDPRVTRIGKFLRRSSLDEFPQLLNVLMGDMSLVGPRPHAVAHNEQYATIIDDYLARHRVKPGMTGWAQVNGLRGETDTPEKMRRRVQFDLYYIDNWSLLFDLKILALTPLAILGKENAY
jgi:putative colanic acid biosynthesis UDP-glucose lipid carrier transferase